jgi:hypothetical protein
MTTLFLLVGIAINIGIDLYTNFESGGTTPSPTPPDPGNQFLLETGDYLLLESGDYLMLEE